jgi:hypothetical protein
MPRKPADLRSAVAGLVLIVAAIAGYYVGFFDFLGRLLVNHAVSTTQEEVERQRNE